MTTARNRAIDRIRQERTLAEKIRLLPAPEATMDEFDDTVIKDERLELIFTCCHPALRLDGQVALTLRAFGGLETADIARAFLVSEETMKRRLSCAKTKIKATGIPFAVPDARLLPDRLDAVLAVIYLSTTRATAAASTSAPKPSAWGKCSPRSCRTSQRHTGCSR